MTESIQVQQADIHTAAVEVAIMRISGKQVTLSVFRQLKEEPVVDADGHFVGLPWGTVNYHPPKECDGADGDHHHVVWQKGNELRRGTIRRPRHETPWPDAANDWLLAASAKGWRPSLGWYEGDRRTLQVKGDTGVFMARPSDPLTEFWRWELRVLNEAEVFPDPTGFTNRFYANRPIVHPATPSESREQLLAEVTEEVRAAYERQSQRDKRWAEVHDLPQLFIAV